MNENPILVLKRSATGSSRSLNVTKNSSIFVSDCPITLEQIAKAQSEMS